MVDAVLATRCRGGTGGGARRTAPEREMVDANGRMGDAGASTVADEDAAPGPSCCSPAVSSPASNLALSAEIRLPGTGGRARDPGAAPVDEPPSLEIVGARLGGKCLVASVICGKRDWRGRGA